MKAIGWEPGALADLADALAASQDPVAFRQDADDALANIASGTISHAMVRRTIARQCILTRVPYSIIYSETDDEVRVWALQHHKRKPNYWKDRLPKP